MSGWIEADVTVKVAIKRDFPLCYDAIWRAREKGFGFVLNTSQVEGIFYAEIRGLPYYDTVLKDEARPVLFDSFLNHHMEDQLKANPEFLLQWLQDLDAKANR